MQTNATFHTFKSSGKYYTTGRGLMISNKQFIHPDLTTRAGLLMQNKGLMPGLSGDGSEFHVTVIPDENIDASEFVSWPIHCPI